MSRSIRKHLIALTCIATLAIALPQGSASAHRTGGHDHDGGSKAPFTLTERATSVLRGNDVAVRGVGNADKYTHDGRVTVALPVRDSRDGDHTKGHHGDDSSVVRFGGGFGFASGGATTTWTKIRANLEHGRITAVVDSGARETVLRFTSSHGGSVAGSEWAMDGRHHGHGASLRLSGAGAASLNAVAGAGTFGKGDGFIGDRRC